MSKVVRDFYYNPPSVYPLHEPQGVPAFATTNSEVYGPNHDREVFKRSMTYRGKTMSSQRELPPYPAQARQARRDVLNSANYYLASSTKNIPPLTTEDREYSDTLRSKGFRGCADSTIRSSNTFKSTGQSALLNTTSLYTTSTLGKGLDYTTQGTDDDIRRSMHTTLRDTQNARYDVYKRAFGKF